MVQQISSTQSCYPYAVDAIRDREYPTLKDVTYLDHAGTTPYAKSLIDKYSQVLAGNLFGNPHSASTASQRTSSRVEDIRLKALRFFNADPDVYDLVFVSNTTAGMKLIAESLRDFRSSASDRRGFWYGYHADSHTSLVGVRALADHGTQCFTTDVEVGKWISSLVPEDQEPKLFAYPAQSNLNGRRFPLKWCNEIRQAGGRNTFTLLDAASLVSTSPLDLSDSQVSPDFVVLSFYKIFGFPDLGALIVRKESGHLFSHRRYFGGGTVDAVTVDDDYCMRKQSSIHDQLEDGTLPFHNIIALESALEVHKSLYGSMANISHHTAVLTEQLYNRLSSIAHANGRPVCRFYQSPGCSYTDRHTQGPIIALNLLDSNGECTGNSEVEKLASVKAIHIRGGTLCNPGGTASLLNLSREEIQANYNAGQRCGDDNDIMQGKPTGALRLSLGAMTTSKDVDRFVAFIKEFYAEQSPPTLQDLNLRSPVASNRYYVESLCVYPIKSCSGFTIPPGMPWKVRAEGLAWDREWGIVHEGTGVVLSQKRYPRMALIKPAFDFEKGLLHITADSSSGIRQLDISLCRDDKAHVHEMENTKVCQKRYYATKSSSVCGDRVSIQVYSSPEVASFFSEVLGVPCTLARFPATSAARHAKDLSSRQRSHKKRQEMPGSFPLDNSPMREPKNEFHGTSTNTRNRIFFSNESPILLITRSSVNRLNEQIKENSKTVTTVVSTSNKAVPASVFRANIVVAENLPSPAHFSSPATLSSSRFEQPYIEDSWSSIQIGREKLQFDVLGSCQRCQMVCIDQLTAERRDEPLSTLAKTRRIGGKVMFGRHLSLSSTADLDLDNEEIDSIQEQERTIMVGDLVMPT